MNRTDAVHYLTAQLGPLMTEVGVLVGDFPADMAGGVGEIVDDALLWTGVPASDLATATVNDADVAGFRKVLRYAGLRFIRDHALNRVDGSISDPNVSKRWAQFVAHLKDSTSEAKAEAEPYLVVDGAGDFTVGAIVFGDRILPPGVEVWSW